MMLPETWSVGGVGYPLSTFSLTPEREALHGMLVLAMIYKQRMRRGEKYTVTVSACYFP
jgi:hypothetical protein